MVFLISFTSSEEFSLTKAIVFVHIFEANHELWICGFTDQWITSSAWRFDVNWITQNVKPFNYGIIRNLLKSNVNWTKRELLKLKSKISLWNTIFGFCMVLNLVKIWSKMNRFCAHCMVHIPIKRTTKLSKMQNLMNMNFKLALMKLILIRISSLQLQKFLKFWINIFQFELKRVSTLFALCTILDENRSTIWIPHIFYLFRLYWCPNFIFLRFNLFALRENLFHKYIHFKLYCVWTCIKFDVFISCTLLTEFLFK